MTTPLYFKYLLILFIPVIFIDLYGFDFFNNQNHKSNYSNDLLLNSNKSILIIDCIDGTVFQDLNFDGLNNGEPAIDSIEVRVFDCDNNLVNTTLTDVMGDWEICALAQNLDYRVEFILSPIQAETYGYSNAGQDNGTNIQFAQTTDVINLGLAIKNESPVLITNCYNFAGYEGQFASNEALIGVPINKISSPTTDAATQLSIFATHEEIGTTFGLAINPHENKAFAASYMKRHAGFGPGGTGAIYEIDLTLTNPPTILADLNAIYGANTAGINVHDFDETDVCLSPDGDSTNYACWNNDVDAWGKVGRTSLGDMDISDDYSTLYALNLEDRTLYPIDMNNPTAVQTPFPFPLDQATDPNVTIKPRDPALDIRPFAVKYNNGLVYVGAVDSELSRERDNICCSRGGGVIYIYSLDPTTGIWTLVIEENIQRNGNNPGTPFFIHWYENYIGDFRDNSHMGLSDIEFDGDDIVLGLRDLSADKFGNGRGRPIEGDGVELLYQSIAGDIVRFCFDSATSVYNLEQNGSCGGVTSTSGPNFQYGWPESSTPRGSFYTGDFFNLLHPQTVLGGLWKDPNDQRIYSTVYELTEVFQAGIKSFDNTTGLTEEIYILLGDTRTEGGFGKAASLGDLESTAIFQPQELGNYVWCDSIQNGIQDACERGVDDMIVQLYNSNGLLIAQDTTDNGQYFFNPSNVDTTGITVDASGVASPNTEYNNLASNTKYYILFGNGQFDTNTQITTIGTETYLGLAQFNANSNNSDEIDSDVDPTNLSTAIGAIPMDLPVICITTDSIGCGNHSYDFGVTCPTFDLALTKEINSVGTSSPVTPGGTVSFDIRIVNQGNIEAFDIDIQDYFDAAALTFTSLQVPSTSEQGNVVSIIGAGPNFELEQLSPGDTAIIQLNFTIPIAYTGRTIINNVEIVDASASDNGPTAEDSDSPLTMINDGSTNELLSDNDIDDDSTGGTDNNADEDDYDPAEIIVECKVNVCLPVTIVRK